MTRIVCCGECRHWARWPKSAREQASRDLGYCTRSSTSNGLAPDSATTLAWPVVQRADVSPAQLLTDTAHYCGMFELRPLELGDDDTV